MLTQKEIVNKILEINHYEKLNPVQELAKDHIGKNTLICTPTASGKTTVFEMFLLDCLVNKKKKVVYISPLKALTFEHYTETKKKFEKELNIKIGISTGDLDSSVKHLANYEVLFLTFEKFDSIVRHSPDWLKDVGLLTIDEIHEIGGNRGATLEIIVTQIKQSYKHINLLGLSATIGNSKELADWLEATLVKTNYRPVPLEIGIFYNNEIHFENQTIDLNKYAEKNLNLSSIIKDTLEKKKQLIVFCNSRKLTMSFAEKYSKIIKNYLSEDEEKKLRIVSREIGEALEQPTSQCLKLFKSTLNGASFHHAGLVSKQRKIVEEAFKKGYIKIIFATPTLAAGINLPAYRVIINNIFRYTDKGMTPIGVNEFMQMGGRAGRPKYDSSGQAICVVNKETDISKVYQTYILSQPTDLESQLSKINLLRMHLLSMILINNINSVKELITYFSNTFYYFIFGDVIQIKENILEIIKEFFDSKFLKETKEGFEITQLGMKICYLYIDPLSANNIITDLEIKKGKDEITDIELLYTVVNTTEIKPYTQYKNENEDELFTLFETVKNNIYFDYEDLYLLSKLYESKMLSDWINEETEDKLIEKYNTTPGQLRDIISRAEWMGHCICEIIKYTSNNLETLKKYKNLRLRLTYGIRKELVTLVELKNIGRIRARRLFEKGIKTISDIKNNPNKFIEVVGKIGLEALKELKIEYDFAGTEEEKENTKNENKQIKVQKKLFDF
ncbi:DEAD/DEAH box helicase [archaeon]|nr:DEAD/DEAH box helicase [archaeon]